MSSAFGRYVPLTPARRMIADWMHFCRHLPMVVAERRMRLGPVVEARKQCEWRPSWVAIFLKAFSVVAARRAELRRSYHSFPWPHLYEHSRSLGLITVERMEAGEAAVLFAKLKYLERLSLTDLDANVRRYQAQPLEEFPIYRRARRTLWLPWFLRR